MATPVLIYGWRVGFEALNTFAQLHYTPDYPEDSEDYDMEFMLDLVTNNLPGRLSCTRARAATPQGRRVWEYYISMLQHTDTSLATEVTARSLARAKIALHECFKISEEPAYFARLI